MAAFVNVIAASHAHHRALTHPSLSLAAARQEQQQQQQQQDPSVTFARQELMVQLEALERSGISVSDRLQPGKEKEMVGYLQTLLLAASSSSSSSAPMVVDPAKELPGTTWKWMYSTGGSDSGLPPRDAVVTMKFADDSSTGKHMDYVLNFSNTLGLRQMKASCSWEVEQCGIVPVVRAVYDKVTTDVLGLRLVPLGWLVAAGRVMSLPVTYLQDDLWIEQQPDGTLNVYVRQDNDAWNR
jgi:hypothetical protein